MYSLTKQYELYGEGDFVAVRVNQLLMGRTSTIVPRYYKSEEENLVSGEIQSKIKMFDTIVESNLV